jgi:hypothetical protein
MAKKIIKSALVAIIKKQLIDHILSSSLGVVSGIRYNVVYLIVDYVFDLYLAPILEQAIREGTIYYDVQKVKKILREYELADTRNERIDRFNDLP